MNEVFTAGVVDADPGADPPWLAPAYVPGVSLDTAVALTAGGASGTGTATGVFAFYPAPSNAQVPRGSSVAGTFENGVLTLRATHRIEQPPGCLTVALQAACDPSAPGHPDGRVHGANRTTFSADRA
ncbi:hypothetical protein [Streptomyces fragilis]|uniref:Uncharacterized protein n=1 Tax=Streptomyces fragilis TaxID=67301 RepID=A0ABV2YDY0_9ACTN|nr:hypothetical protein [Streptomyces fragilis]